MSVKTITQPAQEKLARPYNRRASLLIYGASGLSLAAALIHLWVASEHFEEWWGYGAFMLIAAASQGLFSVLLLRFPMSKLISLLGIAGNLLIVTLYVVSYTWGMPFGSSLVPFDPSVAHMEDAEVLGMIATAAEVGVAFCLVALLEGSLQRVVINLLLMMGASLWVLRITGILP